MVNFQRLNLQELDPRKVVNRPVNENVKDIISDKNYNEIRNILSNAVDRNEELEQPNYNEANEENLQDLKENINEEHEQEIDSDINNKVQPEEAKSREIDIVNLEEIKSNSFKEGYKKAKAEFEEELAKVKTENKFEVDLNEKFAALKFDYSLLEKQVFEALILVFKQVSRKLFKQFPTNFEELIQGLVSRIIKNNKIDGTIIIKYNKAYQVEFEKAFEKVKLDSQFKILIKLEQVENSDTELLEITYKDAELKYDANKLIEEIESILPNLDLQVKS